MKPSIIVGIVFGLITIVVNLTIVATFKDKSNAMFLVSGLLFFNIYFAILFTKKKLGYSLLFIQGFKASVQAGITQSLFYFLSIIILQKYIQPGFFPDLNTIPQYFSILNTNIILFSLISAIFGAILSQMLSNK